jgi:hypothetical protein
MSTKDPNMKVIFGADTKDFDKGAKQVKQGLKDLDKSSESMLSSLSNAFGVSSGKVEQMTSAVRGLGYKLVETGNEGAKALGSVLAKIGPLQAGIAGLGLAAAIAGFKQLKSEADNFKSTIDGMNLSMATSAYIATYKQMLHDLNSDTGKQVAEAMDKWERGFGRFKAQIGATFVTAVGQDQKWYDAFTPSGLVRAWKTATANANEAEAAAGRNAERASQMADLMKEQLTLNNEIKLIDRDIAEYRRQASDKSASVAERAAAEANYRQAVNDKYDKQADLQQRMLGLQKAMDAETANTFEETKKTAEMEGALIDIETARQNELRGIDRISNSIATATGKQAAAAQKAREEAEKMAAVYSRWAGLGTVGTAGLSSLQGSVMGPSLSILPQRQDVEYFKETFQAYLGDWQIAVGIKPQEGAIMDFTTEVEQGLVSMATRTSEIMGNLIGTLASGGNAWGDFKNAAVSALGDMAIAVGKIAIKSGVAMLGIETALKMGNPYVAIAAGAALVALGAAVKSSLSAVASGDYSAGGGGYSSGYSSGGGSNNYEQREVKVYVTGTLEADGDKLITVINNTNRKNYYTQ